MKSVMQHNFSMIPQVEIPRSVFDRTHGYKTTFDGGWLVPFLVDEALPGDTFHCQSTLFTRMMTPIYPIMDNLHLETFYFAVPYRLIWDNWQKFNGEQINPDDSTDFLIPQIESKDVMNEGTLWDYFGLPTHTGVISVSSLPFRAYNLIWNEWFRDENLQDSETVDKDDGPDSIDAYSLLKRGKRHDYFTSCLPWPQKGPGVELPLGGSAPVWGDGRSMRFCDQSPLTSSSPRYGTFSQELTSDNPAMSISTGAVKNVGSSFTEGSFPSDNKVVGLVMKNDFGFTSGLYADLSSASAATINTLRQAFQIQRMYERDARGGTRYTEIIRSHFGVISPDARLQRPEYLGGSSNRINITPVQQTSATTDTSPQGNLAAFGTGIDNNGGFHKSFTEHCIIIGLVTVRADLTYQQKVDRMWSRKTRFDFYWPSFAYLGEQPVYNKELFCIGGGATVDDEVFGYQERYAEYRYKNSSITGLFRSNCPTSLDAWHLSEEFAGTPALNYEFIRDKTDEVVDRVIAVPSEPQFLLDCYIQMKCARPMPVYSVPGLIDHF